MANFIKAGLLLISHLLLVGCASLQNNFELQHHQRSWDQHKQYMQSFNSWDIVGKIAFSDANEGGNANLTWQQQQTSFAISLYGPFRTETIDISGRPGQVTLTNGKGVAYQASSAEEIIQRQLGWTIPVSGLMYWAKGIPIPGMPIDKIKLTSENRLATLQQQGWKIEYLEYKAFARYVLPTKIILSYQNIKIKLIFKNWL